MKVTVPDTAAETLRSILAENTNQPDNIRVFFQGLSWAGPAFGLALDQVEDGDLTYEHEDLKFVMSEEEHEAYGDIVIEDTGFGFKVMPESMVGQSSDCCGSCGSCGE